MSSVRVVSDLHTAGKLHREVRASVIRALLNLLLFQRDTKRQGGPAEGKGLALDSTAFTQHSIQQVSTFSVRFCDNSCSISQGQAFRLRSPLRHQTRTNIISYRAIVGEQDVYILVFGTKSGQFAGTLHQSSAITTNGHE